MEQVGQVADLALDDAGGLLDEGRRRIGPPQQRRRRHDRRQRVAQLVGEQRQELVLGAVGGLGLGAGRLLPREELHVAHGERRLVDPSILPRPSQRAFKPNVPLPWGQGPTGPAYIPRSTRGSSASRSQSPTTLMPSTTPRMASPGKRASHQPVVR